LILILNSQDSFTYNIYACFKNMGANVRVDDTKIITMSEIDALQADIEGFVLSPGPGRPEEEKLFFDVLNKYASLKPILGVCLGHQAIAQFFGGVVVGAEVICHGRVSRIHHDGSSLYKGVPQNFPAMRYNSLLVSEKLPDCLIKSAWNTENPSEIMGIRHKNYNVEGVQFHPESIGTPDGRTLFENFYRRLHHSP
jgi:anthranilate synthase/aminodeoxychorismate synthase-like glutamine amidotransferase